MLKCTEMTVAKLEEATAHFIRKANETSMSASEITEKLASVLVAERDVKGR